MFPRPLEMLLYYKQMTQALCEGVVIVCWDRSVWRDVHVCGCIFLPEKILPKGADRIPEEQRRVMGLEVASGGMTSH